jgi:hypothetical protein
MRNSSQWIPIGGLLATIAITFYIVAQLNGQSLAAANDFTNAATAEVKDEQGRTVLQGPFMPAVEEDGDLERRATLAGTGIDADATGEAEVEFAKAAPTEQEVEFSVTNLPAGARLTFAIDGTDVATATTDRRGRAEVELTVKMPGRE